MKTLAIILFFTGIILRYFIKKRKFQRTSYTGVEVFKSYESAWSTRLLESVGFWLGTFMVLGGVVMYFIA
nr:hypothetical protein [uncultured Pedobacter sp.]